MRTFYILVIFLLITMTLSIAVSISFFIKYRARQKHLLPFYNVNIELKKFDVNNIFWNLESNDELKEVNIKNCLCYSFDDIIKIEDFDFDSILIDEKSHRNILVYGISYKT